MTIYEKKGKYYSRFKIHGQTKHILCHGARNKNEAQAIEDSEKYKLRLQQAGLSKKKSRLRFHQALSKFYRYSKNNKKSHETDRSRVKLLKTLTPSTLLVADMNRDDIEKIKEKLLNKRLSTETINKYLALVSKTFDLLLKDKEIEYNPVSDVKYFKKKHHKVRYLTKDEETRLMNVLPQYMQDIMTTALYTGLRKENILDLKWEQVDFILMNIDVLDSKGNKHIILPMVKPLRDVIIKLKNLKYSKEYVFANPKTGRRYYEIDKCWRRCRVKAGLENVRFHDLRHTVGTRLAVQGVPVNVIQEILAHSDIKTTMKYIHMTEGSKRKALESLL